MLLQSFKRWFYYIILEEKLTIWQPSLARETLKTEKQIKNTAVF